MKKILAVILIIYFCSCRKVAIEQTHESKQFIKGKTYDDKTGLCGCPTGKPPEGANFTEFEPGFFFDTTKMPKWITPVDTCGVDKLWDNMKAGKIPWKDTIMKDGCYIISFG